MELYMLCVRMKVAEITERNTVVAIQLVYLLAFTLTHLYLAIL